MITFKSAATGLAILATTTLQAATSAVSTGTGAPPATLGPYTLTFFPDDPRSEFDVVSSVASPLGGAVGFSLDLTLLDVPLSWGSWSHGYIGDVYATETFSSISFDISLPPDTAAFLFYAEPADFGVFTITAQSADGSLLALDVEGEEGATGFGFYASAGETLSSITITAPLDIALSEFGIAKVVVPEPGTVVAGAGLLGLFGAFACRRFRR